MEQPASQHLAFSVLMSTFYKEKIEYLRQALDSVFHQTLLPNEVVLVEDGILPAHLENFIKKNEACHPQLKVVRYEENRGLGYALNVGLRHCAYDIVARMDTDDICCPTRFQEQITYMARHPEVHVVSAWIDEFVDHIDNIRATRRVPETDKEIRKFAKRRNPVNHPATMFRKEAVESVGGYKPFYLFEDYYLWVRLLAKGYRFYNIQKSLLFFRQSERMYYRRSGWDYVKSEIKFQWCLYRMSFLRLHETISNIIIRTSVRLVSNGTRRCFYLRFLRQ